MAAPARGCVAIWQWILVGAAVALAAYALFLLWLIVAGRKDEARALATLVPDFVVLFRRLLADPRLTRRTKLVLTALTPTWRCRSTSYPTSFLSPDSAETSGKALIVAVVRTPERSRRRWRPG